MNGASVIDGVGTAGGAPESGAPAHALHNSVTNRTSALNRLAYKFLLSVISSSKCICSVPWLVLCDAETLVSRHLLTLCAPGGKGHRTLGSWAPLCDPSTSRAWLASFDKLSLATQKSLDKQKGAPARRAFTEALEFSQGGFAESELVKGWVRFLVGLLCKISDHRTKERFAQKDAKITRFNRGRSTRGGPVWLGSAPCAFGGQGGFPYPSTQGHRVAKRSAGCQARFLPWRHRLTGLIFR